MMTEDRITEPEVSTTDDSSADVLAIEVPAREIGRVLHNIALFVSKDATRPVLTCVHVRIDATERSIIVEATDSYTLAEETLTLPDTSVIVGKVERSYLLMASDLKPIIASLRKVPHGIGAVVTFHGGSSLAAAPITFSADGRTQTVHSYVGDFPNTAQLYPDDQTEWSLPNGVIGVDPARLGTFGKVIPPSAKKAPTGNTSGCTLHFNGPLKPISVEFPDRSTFRGLVMPCRRD